MDETRGLREQGATRRPSLASAYPGRHALRDQEILWDEFLAMGLEVVDSLAGSVAVLCEGRLDEAVEVKRLKHASHGAEVADRAGVPAGARPFRAGRLGLAPHGDHLEGQPRLGADRRPGGPDRPACPQAGGQAPMGFPSPSCSSRWHTASWPRCAPVTRRWPAATPTARADVIDGDRAIDRQYCRVRRELKESLRQQRGAA